MTLLFIIYGKFRLFRIEPADEVKWLSAKDGVRIVNFQIPKACRETCIRVWFSDGSNWLSPLYTLQNTQAMRQSIEDAGCLEIIRPLNLNNEKASKTRRKTAEEKD